MNKTLVIRVILNIFVLFSVSVAMKMMMSVTEIKKGSSYGMDSNSNKKLN